MNKKLFSIIAAAVMLLTAVGCGSDKNTLPVVVTQGASVLSSGVALSKTVVEFDGRKDMNITFGDFMKEYKYYLAGYMITDDSLEQYQQVMAERREYIINYLINEKIMAEKFSALGLSLTDEENAAIDADTAAGIDNMIENLKNRVQASLEQGETLSDEELASRAEEEYNKILADCGLTEDDLRNWQKSIYIQQKLTDHVNEGFTYEYEKAEQEVKDIIADAQAAYKADNSDYDTDSLKSLYIPEGSRYVRHVLVKLDDETISQIRSLRSENKDEEADKLRAERVAEMSDKISEIESLAASGTDFSELMNKYSDDTDTTMSYLVVPGTKKYMAEFTECALGIEKVGATGTTITDYGWHIIEYTSDAVVTEQDRKEYTDALYRYLEDAYKTQNLNERMAEWRAEFKYTIDRETLMLAEETAE